MNSLIQVQIRAFAFCGMYIQFFISLEPRLPPGTKGINLHTNNLPLHDNVRITCNFQPSSPESTKVCERQGLSGEDWATKPATN